MVLVSGDVSKFSIDYLGCISDVGSSRQKFYNNVMPYLEADWVGVDINGMFPEAIMPLSVTFVQADVLKEMRLMSFARTQEEWPMVISDILRVRNQAGTSR